MNIKFKVWSLFLKEFYENAASSWDYTQEFGSLESSYFDSDYMPFSFQSNITSGKYNVLPFFPKWWINICAFHAPKGTH